MSDREARLKRFENEEHHSFPSNTSDNGQQTEILDEEEALKRAMQLSIAESGVQTSTQSSNEKADRAAAEAEIAKLDAQERDTQPEIHKSVSGQQWEEEMVPVPVDESLLSQLIDMGFNDTRSRKAIVHGKNLEGALEWLTEHQDDPDIDQPYMVRKSDTIPKPPMTAEEKALRVKEMQEKIKKRREEREKHEKAEEIRREKERRERGQKMEETMEERQKMQRKRELERQKREKEEIAKERERLRAEIARDKEIRKANKGVLPSVLGVEGYNPSIIQYDAAAKGTAPPVAPTTNSVPAKRSSEPEPAAKKTETAPAVATKPQSTSSGAVKTARKDETPSSQSPEEKIDSAIGTISRYRTGGDGGQALKLLVTFVKNIVENPDEPK